MSACSDPSETRLVPMSEQERDWLSQAIDLLREEGRANTAARVENIVAKWDASPADPAEAAAIALHERSIRAIPWSDEYPRMQQQFRRDAETVLSVLGLRVGVHHDNGETT